jgi:endonuclease/exonuclease/phosphatase (EEP) superfamily protein YafD
LSATRLRAAGAGGGPILAAVSVLLAVAFAAAQFHGPFALLDNLSNFPAHFAAAFLACALLFAWRRRVLPALACLGLAAFALAQVLPWYFAAETAPADPGRRWTRLLVSNVYYGNREHDRLLDLVRAEDPDVVGLVEVSSRWLRKLKPLRETYPYHYEMPDEFHAGLALYSRLPIENAHALALGDEHPSPAIAATLRTPDGEVEIVLAHPTSPIGAAYIARRNVQLAALARHAREAQRPLVLAGDLNVTMWNDAYRPLEDEARLRNARRGRGVAPSWPAIGPFGVPIDHILASPGVQLRNFRTLPGIGSDHLPVAAEFTVP